jgi:sialidase-1
MVAAGCGIARAGDPDALTLFRAGDGKYQNYRIPSAVVTTKGTLLVFCEGRQTPPGRGNDTGEINLLVRRSSDHGKTFGEPSVVWADGKNTCGNPCAVVDAETGAIVLLMTHNLGEDHEREIARATARGTRTVWVTTSTDDGVTWSKPRDITASTKKPDWTWYATGPGVGIQITQGKHKGRLVIPCDYSTAKGDGNSHVIYSDDHGQTWTIGGEAPKREFNESQIVELTDGRLMLNMRNTASAIRNGAPKQRGVCVSDDGGETFKDLRRDPALVEPVCQGSIARYGDWIVFSNPTSADRRENLRVHVSKDDGRTWYYHHPIHAGPSAYSCLVMLRDGHLGVLFECGKKTPYERIDFVRIPPGGLDVIQ